MSIKFLDVTSADPPSVIEAKFATYLQYLSDNRSSIPREAYDFAVADWHYATDDPRCPHDSWLESIQILENTLSEADKTRAIEIHLSLLGAYHDGIIQIKYEGVKSYDLQLKRDTAYKSKWHGDWLVDEVRLSENNSLVHAIDFWLDGRWEIECENIVYSWLPYVTD